MNFHDVELLSAYLDGRLGPSDSKRLESRLVTDENLQAVLDDLRVARSLLRKLPERSVPRNFILTPKLAGLKAPEPRIYPAFRFATVLAALLFIITIAVNGLAPLGSSRLLAAQAPAIGLGGGCNNCGSTESPSVITEAPAAPFSAFSPTEALPSTQDNSRNIITPPAPLAPKAAIPFSAKNQPTPLPTGVVVPLIWQIFIGFVMVICGAIAWLLRRRNEQEFQKRWNKK
jgi:hypothetical protein